MADTAKTTEPTTKRPAGVPTRLIAFALDILLVKLAVLVLVTVLGVATSGGVRLASPVISTTSCGAYGPLPARLNVPADFEQAQARICTRSLFGLLRDDQLVVRAKVGSDDAQDVQSLPVDRNGQPANPIYLDDLTPFLLAAYLVLLEWHYGATAGKWLLALFVRSLRGGHPSPTQAAQRTTVKLLALLPIPVSTALKSVADAPWRFSLDLTISRIGTFDSLIVHGLQLLSILLILYGLVAALRRWPLPHDRLAGTEVVREFER